MSNPQKYRVAILCGPNIQHRSTCATLIQAGVNVVGICVCDQTSGGLPLGHLRRTLKKHGTWTLLGQILGRLYYNLLNKKKDQTLQRELYNTTRIETALAGWDGNVHRTDNYANTETVAWLKSLDADIFVVHTGYWVGKKVRRIPGKKIVIGGHPGLIPAYRGSHSGFWAVMNGHPEDVGCSIFWLDGGADTGDLIKQERIPIENGDSYVSLGWKGMIREAEMQAETILNFEQGTAIPRIEHKSIPENSYYDIPTLFDYLKYRKKQKHVR